MDQVNRYAKIQAKEKFRILQSVWLIWAWPAQIKGSVHPYEPLKYFREDLRRHIGIPLRCRLDILFGDSSIQNRCPLKILTQTSPGQATASVSRSRQVSLQTLSVRCLSQRFLCWLLTFLCVQPLWQVSAKLHVNIGSGSSDRSSCLFMFWRKKWIQEEKERGKCEYVQYIGLLRLLVPGLQVQQVSLRTNCKADWFPCSLLAEKRESKSQGIANSLEEWVAGMTGISLIRAELWNWHLSILVPNPHFSSWSRWGWLSRCAILTHINQH